MRSWGPQVPPKVDFLQPLGSIWDPFGRPVGSFGLPLGSFLARLRAKKASFLPCDVQAHFLHHFGRLFTPFWWYFGELFDGLGLPNRKRILKSRNPREYTFCMLFRGKTWVRVSERDGKTSSETQKKPLKTISTTKACFLSPF